jgi:hypothetical protein
MRNRWGWSDCGSRRQVTEVVMLGTRKNLMIGCVLAFASGCAFVDQELKLGHPHAICEGSGTGELCIAKPNAKHNLAKNSQGFTILGTVQTTFGIKTADVITRQDVGDWISEAYQVELQAAGYDTKIVQDMHSTTSKGISLTILSISIDQDPGFFTVGAITVLQFNIYIWKKSKKVRTLNVTAKGDHRSMIGSARNKEISLHKALDSALIESLPEILKTLES